jgi:hypothetical protein
LLRVVSGRDEGFSALMFTFRSAEDGLVASRSGGCERAMTNEKPVARIGCNATTTMAGMTLWSMAKQRIAASDLANKGEGLRRCGAGSRDQ